MASTPITQRKADEQITRLIVITEGIQKRVEKIDTIEDKQDQLTLELAKFGEKFESLCMDNKKLKETIFGNGKDGIDKDVSHLKSRMKVIIWVAAAIGLSLITFSVGLWLYLVVTYGAVALP